MVSDAFVQIEVVPEDGYISGRFLAHTIGLVASVRRMPWTTATDVDLSGAARRDLTLTARDVLVCRHRWLLGILGRADQIVWATFFFCSTRARCEAIRPEETYAESACKASLVVRVVDASYVSLLAAAPTAKRWRETFPLAPRREGPIEQMSFPE